MKQSQLIMSCPNCKSLFTIYSENLSILEVSLVESLQTYEYCSRKCLEEKLTNINSGNGRFDLSIEIVSTEVISESNPFKLKVVLKVKDLKVERI